MIPILLFLGRFDVNAKSEKNIVSITHNCIITRDIT